MARPFCGQCSAFNHLAEFAVVVTLLQSKDRNTSFDQGFLSCYLKHLTDLLCGGVRLRQKGFSVLIADIPDNMKLFVGQLVRINLWKGRFPSIPRSLHAFGHKFAVRCFGGKGLADYLIEFRVLVFPIESCTLFDPRGNQLNL